MALIQCGLVLAASATLVPSHGSGRIAGRLKPGTPPQYTAQQVEYYLSAEEVGYIRPGFNVELVGISNVGPGKKPVVEVKYYDDLDQPLDYEGKITPGSLSISFILAVWDPDARQYTSLTLRTRNGVTNPSSDRSGSWNHLGLGHSVYTFGTTLPSSFDVTKTYTLGVYSRRTLTDIIGKNYIAPNILYNFRPDGQTAAPTWDVMAAATTCNRCHDPLEMHGGTRREPGMCALCHTPQIALDRETGESFDLKVMIHKIHRGEGLPSVEAGGEYVIAGEDYSEVAFPQDIRNCTTCHEAGNAESHVWYANPSRKACGSCHDDVNWETGANHAAGPQLNDALCTACHFPTGDTEFDISVMRAHTIPTKSEQLEGVVLTVLDVSNTAPGQSPVVTYTLTDGAGMAVAPASLNRFRFLLGGPTTDYTEYFRENANTTSTCSAGGTCTFTFAGTLPLTATGTWTLAADYYRNVTIDNHTDTGLSVREAGLNPIVYFIVTDAQPVPRREVADIDKCNVCHDTLAFHGGQRFKVQECVICHNPNQMAESVEGEPDESVHFKWLVHRLHTGHDLTHDFSVDGNSFNELHFPGDRRNCLKCHVAGTYGVPLPDGVLPTMTPRDWYSPMQPAAAACLACHDTIDAAAHAYVNTAPFGEACASCHGDEREFAVERVHAR